MAPSEYQRVYNRKAYHADVRFAVNIHHYFAELKDISLSGAFITMNPIPRIEDGDDIFVTIPFAYLPEEVQLKAQVMRYAEEGLGIAFF
jgi:PilZ domain